MNDEKTVTIKGDIRADAVEVTVDGKPLSDLREVEIRVNGPEELGGPPRLRANPAANPHVADIPRAVLARAAAEIDASTGEPKEDPAADPVAVRLAAREIYAQLPGSVLAQLRAIARAHGKNRHARRATAAILRRYFNERAAATQRYAAKKANAIEARKTPTQKRDERNPCPLF